MEENILNELIDKIIELKDKQKDNEDKYNQLIKDVSQLKGIENLTVEHAKILVSSFANGYFSSKKDEMDILLSEVVEKAKNRNNMLIEEQIGQISTKTESVVNEVINELKQDLNAFKSTITNGKDGKDGVNGKDGINGKDGKDGLSIKGDNGLDGLDGKDGLGIKDISYKANTLIIELTNDTKKEFKLNLGQGMVVGGGGVSKAYVDRVIKESIEETYSNIEIDNLLNNKADKSDTYSKNEVDTKLDNLIGGASNILDSFGEVESVLGAINTQLNANSQSIANLTTAQYDLGTMSYTKAESDAKYQAKADENLFIQNAVPTLATGKQALWIDNSNGNIALNLVTGD